MPEPAKQQPYYFAEAHALHGSLQLPIEQDIPHQASVKLFEKGGYLSEHSTGYRLESILSYAAAYTQVSGHKEIKTGHGYNTLATSVVEGLNLLDVITCDRVVSQIFTEHPPDRYVPIVSFLGTRFENLRIAGHEVKFKLNRKMLGDKPEGDLPYTKDPGFIARVTGQHAEIRQRQSEHPNLLTELLEHFNRTPESFETASGNEEQAEFSLVSEAACEFPGHYCGHVIRIPHFGTVYLATVKVTHSDRHPEKNTLRKTLIELTMVDFRLGCAQTAKGTAGVSRTNGMPGTG